MSSSGWRYIPSADSSSDESMQPDVVPVGFDFDGDYFYVGGINILKSTKYKMCSKITKSHSLSMT